MGWSVRARSGLVALLSVAGSCAPVSQHPLENAGAPYDVAEVERTLAFGYSTILERHLERGTAAVVALEGLRGLSGIDPEISVARQGDFVVLAASDRVVARYPAPGDDVAWHALFMDWIPQWTESLRRTLARA